MNAQVRLEVTSGPLQGKAFTFDRHDTFLFGRKSDCHAQLSDDDAISRYHFLLEVNPPAARLRDLGSRNGTYVNDVCYGGPSQGRLADAEPRLAEVDLRHGDRIAVGRTTILFKTVAPSRGPLVLPAVSPSAESSPPQLPGYELQSKLGSGGMGAVYRGVRRSDGLPVAVKIMLPKIAVDESRRRQFLREIEVIYELRHPHIVGLLDSGACDGAFYFVMELCTGGSLAQLRERHGGTLPEGIAVTLLLQCLDALGFAHSRSFVHRDLKPANILLAGESGEPIAKLGDFGLAKHAASAGLSGMTATGQFGGTLSFMPREQLTGFKYPRAISDLWSLAATFYYLLSGRVPLDFPAGRDPIAVLLADEPVPLRNRNPHISPQLAEVLDRGLNMEPGRRYLTADALRQAVAKAQTR